MNPLEIIRKYYPPRGELYHILTNHSRLVADKCLQIAANNNSLKIDRLFVEEAAMLHDIGIYMTNAPSIMCFGQYPYICHGYLGADLLRKEGFPAHALVCERHTGTGISKEEIELKNLAIPLRNYIPQTIEEQLICFADKFFSKTKPGYEKTIEEARNSMAKLGEKSVRKFDDWTTLFL